MLSKAIITFLAIGALWVNVLATPIPARLERTGEDSHSSLSSSPSPPPSYDDPNDPVSQNPGLLAVELPPRPNLEESSSKGKKLAIYGGGGLVAGSIGATIIYLAFHNHTRREFGLESKDSNSVTLLPVIKREPMSEDGASDSLSSPLKREPEPASPSL